MSKPSRRPRQRLAAQREISCPKGRTTPGALPLRRPGRDALANSCAADPQSGRHMPTPRNTFVGLDVHVVAGRVHIFRLLVAKLDSDVGLVRQLVLRKPGVAVDPHQRTANPGRHGRKTRRHSPRMRLLHRDDEPQRDIENVIFVAALVLLEPLAVVVGFQSLRETAWVRGSKAREARRHCSAGNLASASGCGYMSDSSSSSRFVRQTKSFSTRIFSWSPSARTCSPEIDTCSEFAHASTVVSGKRTLISLSEKNAADTHAGRTAFHTIAERSATRERRARRNKPGISQGLDFATHEAQADGVISNSEFHDARILYTKRHQTWFVASSGFSSFLEFCLTSAIPAVCMAAGSRCKNELLRDDVFCLRTFLPLGHFHRDLLSFFKGFESFHLDSSVMHEYILTTLTLYETKPFVIIEPLNGPFNSFA